MEDPKDCKQVNKTAEQIVDSEALDDLDIQRACFWHLEHHHEAFCLVSNKVGNTEKRKPRETRGFSTAVREKGVLLVECPISV